MLALSAAGATLLTGCSTSSSSDGTEDVDIRTEDPPDGRPPVVIRDIEDIRDQVIVEEDVGVVVRRVQSRSGGL